jgi:hypothetical protein
MSFQDITIYRDLPIIGKYVQVPPNRESEKTSVTVDAAEAALEASFDIEMPETKFLSLGSGIQVGSKYGAQRFLRLPGIHPDEWYRNVDGDSEDPADTVRNA